MMISLIKLLSKIEGKVISYYQNKKEIILNNPHWTAIFLLGIIHSKNIKIYQSIIQELVLSLLQNQDDEMGYYIEKHINYHQPSAIITSLVGISLIESKSKIKDHFLPEVNSSIEKISVFLLSQELKPGSYKKSYGFPYQILNSNASITLFFAKYFEEKPESRLKEKIEAFINSLPNFLIQGGVFSYGIRGEKYYIPSVYYHALTLTFLIRLNSIYKSYKLSKILNVSLKWLIESINSERMSWENSGLPFSVFMNQAYAFSLYCMFYCGNSLKSSHILNLLEKNSHGGFFFRLDNSGSLIQRIRISLLVGKNSGRKLLNKSISIAITLVFSFSKYRLNYHLRTFEKNPVFSIVNLKTATYPPFSNSLNFFTTLETYCYLSMAYHMKLNYKNSQF